LRPAARDGGAARRRRLVGDALLLSPQPLGLAFAHLARTLCLATLAFESRRREGGGEPFGLFGA
tara:strand:- start:458 stop:649 length:192 start_codon:yes stop_codon:yes gene_type:complete